MEQSRPRVLMLAANGFAELVETRELLLAAGAEVVVASPERGPIAGVVYDEASAKMSETVFTPDVVPAELDLASFDALVLPGGVRSPDSLRMNEAVVGIVQSFVAADKVVGAICHGPWLLVEADVVRGRRVTCWRSIRTDLRNAGATVMDEPAVTDGRLVTSRMPADIPVFTRAVLDALHAASK